MTPDPNLDLLCKELREKHNCHTIILYGSRARDDARTSSDYDVLGVRESGESVRDARPWQGTYLDAFVHPETKIAKPDETMIHMRAGRVLLQKGDLGTRFLASLGEIFRAGPKKLTADEIEARKVWAG